MTDLPEKLGKYKILGVAGRGSMGLVYIGYDPFVDRKVAIKVCTFEETGLHAGHAESKARRMFFNEAQAAGSLDHPNILRVYDAGEFDGQPYIAMEYVENADTLHSHCEPGTLLSQERVVAIMAQCAKALDYAHQRGVTHRDIKPANLMLTRDGQVKIVDFGIAQRSQTEKTQVIGAFGSPRYMSPEQAQDDVVASRSDLYSLGVVLYELLAGMPPFTAQGLTGLIYKILHEEPTPLQQIRPDVSPRLAAIVHRAIQKDPNKRFQTGKEMAEALEGVLIGDSQPMPEPSPEQKLQALRGLRFLEGFSDAEVTEVMDVGHWEQHAGGASLITEGAQEQAFFLVVAGEVTIVKGGREVGRLSQGDCFGEMGYLSNMPRSASVSARGPVTVLKIGEPLTDWASLPCQLHFNKAFQRTLIERLAQTTDKLSGGG